MDFGTMSTKVAKGRYRSLEEFTVCSHLTFKESWSTIEIKTV